ncbi:hypothetical protein H1Q63_20160 [Desmonostoc muscorum CCALA 125]|nr:hypothetical protein [Desmonostoc muscorum CCALA 125]
MPYLLLETLISLHCGNPSKNLNSKVSYFELLKSIFNLCLRLAIALKAGETAPSLLEEMDNERNLATGSDPGDPPKLIGAENFFCNCNYLPYFSPIYL